VIFNIRYELTSYDLAYALAIQCEIDLPETPPTIAAHLRNHGWTKTEIRKAARSRLELSGTPDSWPDLEPHSEVIGLLRTCREHVNALWPKGA
jgi:hypothetical protein